MGQIVSSAAKPKRCNISKLSQLGTPAAGEYILVSSDNSMNAAGQGNFDCFIVGDGTTAATALDLHKLEGDAAYELIKGIHTEVTTTYSNAGYIAKSNGAVTGTGGTWIHSDFIPVSNWVTAGVFLNHASVALVAFYSSNDLSTYISGINGADYNAGSIAKTDVTIPDNAKYVIFSTDSSRYTLSVKTLITSEGLESRVETLEEKAEDLEERVEELEESGVEIVNDLTTGGSDKALSAEQGKVMGEILNGSSAQKTTEYTNAGYIAYADGSIVTGNTWIHSDLIPFENFISVTKLIFNGSVSSIAFYDANRGYISGINAGTGISDPTLKAGITAPSGTAYIAFSTNSSSASLSVTYTDVVVGLVDKVDEMESSEGSTVKFTEQLLTPSQQSQARENIGIVNANKYVHFSLDDCTFWADLIINENTYTSCFDNSVLARLKTFHDTYGHCYTLNCFIVATVSDVEYSIANVPSKFASEFAANKDWLRFAFHGTTTDETFGSTDAATLLGYYNTFVTAIHTMTGTYECIDKVTRLSSYTGSLSNITALRDAKCGITGLLTNDRDVSLSVGTSYYLSSAQNNYMHTHDVMFDGTNLLWFFRTQRRLENDTIEPSALASLNWANFTPILEIFWHETTGWAGNYAFTTWLKPWFDYLKENGYQNAFTADIMKIN